MADLLRARSCGQAVANSADIGLDATGNRQQVAVLGNEGGDQVLERGSFPVAHNRQDEADQRSKQLKRLPALLQDGCEGISDAVFVITGFCLGRVFPCHSRLHALAGSVGRRSANGQSVRAAVREPVSVGFSGGVREPTPKAPEVHMDNPDVTESYPQCYREVSRTFTR